MMSATGIETSIAEHARYMQFNTSICLAFKRAFTLVELLIVIGLITLVTTWVVFNQTAIGLSFTQLSPQEVFRLAVQEARYQAQILNTNVTLTWDIEAQRFVIAQGSQTIDIPDNILPQERLALDETLELSFQPKLPTEHGGAFSLRDSEEYGPSEPLKLVFSPYGIGSEGEIFFQEGASLATSLTLEPFSNQALPDDSNR